MNFFDKFKVWVDSLKKVSFEYWNTIWVVNVVLAGGGILAAFFGWVFAIIVPAWLIFVAFVLKKSYKKRYKK